MNEDTHVYCTNCIFGEDLIISLLKNDEIPTQCKLCNPYNPEDSMPYEERKYYKKKVQWLNFIGKRHKDTLNSLFEMEKIVEENRIVEKDVDDKSIGIK